MVKPKDILTKVFLEREYIFNRKSSLQIAKENHLLKERVLHYLHKYNLINGHRKDCKCTCCKMKRNESRGKNALHYKGCDWITLDGYRMTHDSNDKKILQHRLVMEEHLNRKLKIGEIVHHINEDRLDNRLENLQLLSGTSEHNSIHKHRLNTGKKK